MQSRQIVTAEQVDLLTPGRRDYIVCFEHPSVWAQVKVPLTVLVGPETEAGRGLLAIGGTHGDEYEGPLAIKNLLMELPISAVRGRLVFVPVLNVSAFRAGTRDTPEDGVNLNRAFMESAGRTITFRIADFVEKILFPEVDIVIDIHSGGLVACFPALAEFHHIAGERRSHFERAARDFGTKFVQIYQNLTPGLLTSRAEELGKLTIGTELGWGRHVFPAGVACARRGILSAAIHAGLVDLQVPNFRICPESEQVLVDTSGPESTILAPYSGYFEPFAELGTFVERGQTVGQLHDFERIDDTPLAVRAPHSGWVICLASQARVTDGQVVLQIGTELEWSD